MLINYIPAPLLLKYNESVSESTKQMMNNLEWTQFGRRTMLTKINDQPFNDDITDIIKYVKEHYKGGVDMANSTELLNVKNLQDAIAVSTNIIEKVIELQMTFKKMDPIPETIRGDLREFLEETNRVIDTNFNSAKYLLQPKPPSFLDRFNPFPRSIPHANVEHLTRAFPAVAKNVQQQQQEHQAAAAAAAASSSSTVVEPPPSRTWSQYNPFSNSAPFSLNFGGRRNKTQSRKRRRTTRKQ